jgi:hypothetical protein
MKTRNAAFFACVTLSIVFLSGSAAWAETDNDPAATVQAFNEAFTNRDKDTAVAQLASDGVQFTLRSLHDGVNPDKMVTPITSHWSTIIPVILGATSSYTREVEILSSEVHGDVSTVWTRTRTVSVRSEEGAASENEFTEVYLLVSTPEGWKIASMADNRQATRIAGASQ